MFSWMVVSLVLEMNKSFSLQSPRMDLSRKLHHLLVFTSSHFRQLLCNTTCDCCSENPDCCSIKRKYVCCEGGDCECHNRKDLTPTNDPATEIGDQTLEEVLEEGREMDVEMDSQHGSLLDRFMNSSTAVPTNDDNDDNVQLLSSPVRLVNVVNSIDDDAFMDEERGEEERREEEEKEESSNRRVLINPDDEGTTNIMHHLSQY